VEAATNEEQKYGIFRLCRMFSTHASEADFLLLANTALREEDATVKAFLLTVFQSNSFPLEITPLLEYAQSDNEHLSGVAINILEKYKDKRIHDLAIKLLEAKGLDSPALDLLKQNYRKSDDGVIQALIMKSSDISHEVQRGIRGIYSRHRSTDAFRILHKVYLKGECSYCRYGIVQAMRHCGVLSGKILNECVYDSYEDTRRLAKRLISRPVVA